jgi:type III pantothenate kinase
MKLLIDIGNTRIKLACLDGESVRFMAALPTQDEQALAHGLAEQITRAGPFQSAMGVCVGQPATQQLVQTVVGRPMAIQWVESTAHAAGVTNGYPDPTQLGADRWVAIIGLTRYFSALGKADKPGKNGKNNKQPSKILATFGTATTIDTLSGEQVFRGGLILPGMALMRSSLAAATARLPAADGLVADNPTSTTSAIASGIEAAQIGALKQQIAIAEREDGRLPEICVSGGAFGAIEHELARHFPGVSLHHLPHTVLDGLAVLAQP